ncbi:unnamed protein product [Parnassius apollo]|uniref:(apollo) hypothetical protein n=1 Tax=Parnassius apollo TaxID=110799 RepID=A0A8S3XLH6_PARAO|nr:unnamed protein product [Parnassius apollo]
MNKYSDNYYLRECYLEKDEVPTQSVIIKTMSPSLATVYFKSMTPKLKVLAGLEPPLKGGGSDWYVPPDDLLKGRSVLKPLKKEFLSKLGFNGIDFFGDTIIEHHLKSQEVEKRKALLESDVNWKSAIEQICEKQNKELSKKAAQRNTNKIKDAFHEFTVLYTSSINRIESLLLDASVKEIERVRNEVHSKMLTNYKTLVKQQATMLYDRYTKNLHNKKIELKEQFICNVEKLRTELGNKIHDINVEKHIAIEKLRKLLECQNLACQIYVALKEKEGCEKLKNQSKHEHYKVVKMLTEEIARNNIEIEVAKEKEKEREKLNWVWKAKICQVVKKFQEFIAYTLKTIPEQADFFLNVEKLLLLQLGAAVDNPSVESLFEPEREKIREPVSEPRPFFLFCDEGLKPSINSEICSKQSISSTAQLPVIVVNKRCIYAACDNLEQFADKVEQVLNSEQIEVQALEDDHDYTYDIPVKCTPSHQLLELKDQSSMMQILQKEMINTKNVPIECCCFCKLPHCFSNHIIQQEATGSTKIEQRSDNILLPEITSESKELSKEQILEHTREPKLESYFKFVEPKTCKCAEIAKKPPREHLPAYMRKMSAFDYPDLPNYEECSLNTLKKIVQKAKDRGVPKKDLPKPVPLPKHIMKDVGTQYSDQEFEYLCTCFDEKVANNMLDFFAENVKRNEIDASLIPHYLNQNMESFIQDRALSLRNLLKQSPELEEIFKNEQCLF